MQANAAAFQPFLLSILALPLHIEISAKQTKLLFLVTYCIQAIPKFDFFLEDFDSCQNQTQVFSLKKKFFFKLFLEFIFPSLFPSAAKWEKI